MASVHLSSEKVDVPDMLVVVEGAGESITRPGPWREESCVGSQKEVEREVMQRSEVRSWKR